MIEAPIRRRRPTAVLILAIALLIAIFWLFFRNTEHLVADAGWRLHTYQVIAEIRGLGNALLDAEAGERGYLLSGDERFRTLFQQGGAEIPRRLARLREMTADNPAQQRRIAAFAPAASAEIDDLDRGVAGRLAAAARAAAAAQASGAQGAGGDAGAGSAGGAGNASRQPRMDRLRADLAEMEGVEARLLELRDQSMVTSLRRANLSLLGGAAVAAMLLAGAFLAVLRESDQRRRAELATRRANVRLEAANTELEAFSYSVSHDLRAPLRAIDGFSLALVEDAGPLLAPADRQTLARVRAAAQRMASLIDDLLRLAKISRMPFEPRTVDLSALAAAVVEELRASDPERRVQVAIESGVAGVGDERLLRIVLANLLGNAWKFTRQRPEAHIAFGVERGGDDGGERGGGGGEAVYRVRDDGAGFDMAYAGKLFGAFQRLHAERDFEGTGIGLATVARVVHLHGGRIWGESEIDRGATFRFTLGAADRTAAKESTP